MRKSDHVRVWSNSSALNRQSGPKFWTGPVPFGLLTGLSNWLAFYQEYLPCSAVAQGQQRQAKQWRRYILPSIPKFLAGRTLASPPHGFYQNNVTKVDRTVNWSIDTSVDGRLIDSWRRPGSSDSSEPPNALVLYVSGVVQYLSAGGSHTVRCLLILVLSVTSFKWIIYLMHV